MIRALTARFAELSGCGGGMPSIPTALYVVAG
jgi:16S rRNA G527 N7-methylase RsmG